MFSRFFKKSRPSDQREHYRRAPGKKAALGVRLALPTGEVVPGELIDVSAGGAAIRFEADLTSILELETLYELTNDMRSVGLISHTEQVKAMITEGFDVEATPSGSHIQRRNSTV